ncbi:MAG: glycosyltransferase family 4 protein [Candidatus Sifarchaeia archaeon]
MILISNPTSVHTINWLDGLTSQGFEVKVVYEEFWTIDPEKPEVLVDTIPLKTKGGYSLLRESLVKLRLRSIFKDIPARTNLNQRLDFLAPQLEEAISDFDANFVHANGLQAAALLANRSSFRPYSISIYGSDILLAPYRKPYLAPLMKKALEESSLIHVQGDSLANRVNEMTPSCSDKILKATWGADTKLFSPNQPDDQLSSLGLPKTRWILSCRALFPLYRISTIIESFSVIAKEIDDVSLIIGGQGSERQSLEQLVSDLNLSDRVFFTGHLDRETMSQLFSSSYIYVQYPESDGVSITAMEAMSSGLPIISSEVGDVPTIVHHQENGFLVDTSSSESLTESMRKLLNDRELRDKMGRQSREDAEQKHDRSKFFANITMKMREIASNTS